jgi:hypothetical protein
MLTSVIRCLALADVGHAEGLDLAVLLELDRSEENRCTLTCGNIATAGRDPVQLAADPHAGRPSRWTTGAMQLVAYRMSSADEAWTWTYFAVVCVKPPN